MLPLQHHAAEVDERIARCRRLNRAGNTSEPGLQQHAPHSGEQADSHLAAEREGRLWPGARVLLSAFGAGFTWGAGVVEWGGLDDA